MRTFDVPEFYRSPIIGRVKAARKAADPRKQDFSPSMLDFGTVRFLLARHFGFCYGVEHAIEVAYRAISEQSGRNIFLLSEMIHNPEVNEDLQSRGVRFLMDPDGTPRIPLESLTSADVVVVPAFGTTLEISKKLADRGVDLHAYDTTCPFVEKVWKRSAVLSGSAHTVVIHGKPGHEETRATFSHAAAEGHALIVKDRTEAQWLVDFLADPEGQGGDAAFAARFAGRATPGFVWQTHLSRIGVVNQTTMLAAETQEIADLLRAAVTARGGEAANTRDTLCYATNDNQQATRAALEAGADLAVVVGGYNSSNTSHLVELCEERMPTYFIRNELEFTDGGLRHFDVHAEQLRITAAPFPQGPQVPTILLTSGASCPDASVDRVLQRILVQYPGARTVEEVLATV
jgi:4-hydroxy-3-methylbut-2-enyl diphosphate reductase